MMLHSPSSFAESEYLQSRPAAPEAARLLHGRTLAPAVRTSNQASLRRLQTKLAVSQPSDALEQEAARVAEQIMRMAEPSVRNHAAPHVQRMCADCEKEQTVQSKQAPGQSPEVTPALQAQIGSLHGDGQPLPESARAFFEPRFVSEFGGVRVHHDDRAAASAAGVHARAYTLGTNIVFARGEYQPESSAGRLLLAHELAHVVQQGSGIRAMRQAIAEAVEEESPTSHTGDDREIGCAAVAVRERGGELIARDLAVAPTHPGAAEPVLTEAELQQAIRYNAFRFKDPYSIAVVRDLVGVPRFPAVSDEDLARAVARYQADFGLVPDGQAGPTTTRRLTVELEAEALPQDAAQLRSDNYVTWTPAAGTHNGCAAGADAAGRATFFQWDVNFTTSLRNGWLIQEIVNTRARTTCAGGAIPETLTPHYWEVWWIDGSGHARIPTAINAARTRVTASAAPAPADDLWRRNAAAPSTGNWGMTARLFTTLRLPAGFAFGAVPEALALPATAAAPNADDLGLVAAQRPATGRWNCCGPAATHFHTP